MQKNPVELALNSLLQAEKKLQDELAGIQQAIASIRKNLDASSSGTSEYDKEWSPANKFMFLLKRHKRFLHFREAAELIAEIEGQGDVKELTSKLSSGTGSIKQNGQIVRVQASKSNIDSFWGSPRWLDETGKIKPGHEFNPDYLGEGKKAPLFEL